MQKHYCIFKGVKSNDIALDLMMAQCPPKPSPAPRYDSIVIAGRQGTLTTTDGTYDTFLRSVEFTVFDVNRDEYGKYGNNTKLNRIRSLYQGCGWLTLDDEPERKYWARVKNQIDFNQVAPFTNSFIVQFECQPFSRELYDHAISNLEYGKQYTSITVNGVTKQTVTVQGKNLFRFTSKTFTAYGITCEIANDGTIHLKGTSTNTVAVGILSESILQNLLTVGNSYTLSTDLQNAKIYLQINYKNTNNIDSYVAVVNNSSKTNVIQSLPTGSGYHMFIGVLAGAIIDETFHVQLEAGTTATAYEPFIPNRPSIDYLADITSTVNPIVSVGTQNFSTTFEGYSLPNGICDTYNLLTGTITKNTERGTLGFSETGYTLDSVNNGLATFNLPNGQYFTFGGSSDTVNCQCVNFESKSLANVGSSECIATGILNNVGCCKITILTSRLTEHGWSDTATTDAKIQSFIVWLSINNPDFRYQLATPVTTQSTAHTIQPVLNNASITTSGGTLSWLFTTVQVPNGKNSMTILNHSPLDSQPTITLYGTGNLTIKINDKSFTVLGVVDKVIIDSESFMAYNDSVLYTTIGDFPTFKGVENILLSETNIVEFDSNLKIEILPNWRYL